jgi:hypothetical protein
MLKKFNIIFVLEILFILALLFSMTGNSAPTRLSQIDFDITKVFKLYSNPGRDTSIYFPCNVEYATGGTDEDIKITMPRKFPNLVTIYLTKGRSQSTSLKVFCSEQVFVFDVVPSAENHVDFLKITRIHGELPRYFDEKPGLKSDLNGKTIFSTKENGGVK